MSKFSSLKFDVEKFDGKINFGLWQVQVKDVLIQSGLHKVLKEKSGPVLKDSGKGESGKGDSSKGESSMSNEDWEEMDLRAASVIRLCLAKNVLANVHGIHSAKELWEKLEGLYQAKGISNRLYLKEQFHTLRMEEGAKISDHLSVLNGIVSELESIGVEIEDEDKALRLILSLPSSYEHMKPILVYGKETLNFTEVTGKLLSEERRLKGGGRTSSEDTALVASNGTIGRRITPGRKYFAGRVGNLGTLRKIVKMVEQVRQVAPTIKLIVCLVKTLNLSFEKDMYILIAYH
ncbi:hypothetical protein ACOSQ2_030968 [Xanthoceras sorbifolium]